MLRSSGFETNRVIYLLLLVDFEGESCRLDGRSDRAQSTLRHLSQLISSRVRIQSIQDFTVSILVNAIPTHTHDQIEYPNSNISKWYRSLRL
jgi:hypothetical protein